MIKRAQLDQVWWLFCRFNPFKKGVRYESFTTRKRKAEEIIRGFKKIKIINTDDIYTYKTLKEMRIKFPQNRFFWIMGMDNVSNFHKWEMYESFHEMVDIIVVDRNEDLHTAMRSKFATRFHQRTYWNILPIKKVNISSTILRGG